MSPSLRCTEACSLNVTVNCQFATVALLELYTLLLYAALMYGLMYGCMVCCHGLSYVDFR